MYCIGLENPFLPYVSSEGFSASMIWVLVWLYLDGAFWTVFRAWERRWAGRGGFGSDRIGLLRVGMGLIYNSWMVHGRTDRMGSGAYREVCMICYTCYDLM